LDAELRVPEQVLSHLVHDQSQNIFAMLPWTLTLLSTTTTTPMIFSTRAHIFHDRVNVHIIHWRARAIGFIGARARA